MAVETPQLKIDPYTSTVPMVQMSPDQMESASRPAAPLQGQFGGRKGSPGLAVGDALFKGFMAGHQKKAEQKYAQAQATINAADSATEAAYAKYQDALTQASGKVDDPKAKAAYDAYLGVFGQSKDAKAQFAMPEKDAKGKKKAGEKGEKKTGFGSIKDFFEANPHIVPQIALLTMQPKPPGQSAEGKQQLLNQQATETEIQSRELANKKAQQRTSDENMVAAYGRLTPEEIAKLPPEIQKQVADPQSGVDASRYRINLELPAKAKFDWFTDEAGAFHSLPEGTQDVPSGWKLVQKPTAAGTNKLGTVGDFLSTVATDNKLDAEKLNASQKGYLEQLWHFYQTNPTASSSTSWYVDDKGNWQPRTAPGYRGPVPPKPPAGVFPSNFVLPGSPARGAISAPPEKTAPGDAGAKPTGTMAKPPEKSATGKIAAPPQHGEKQPMRSWQATQNTEKVETEKKDRYQKADDKYKAAIALARVKAPDAATFEKMKAEAQSTLDSAKMEIEKWYAQQVHAVGGTVPGDKFTVTLPNGAGTVTFKSKADMDSFKRDAGIQ